MIDMISVAAFGAKWLLAFIIAMLAVMIIALICCLIGKIFDYIIDLQKQEKIMEIWQTTMVIIGIILVTIFVYFWLPL